MEERVHTSNFPCAEPNANEPKERIFLVNIRLINIRFDIRKLIYFTLSNLSSGELPEMKGLTLNWAHGKSAGQWSAKK